MNTEINTIITYHHDFPRVNKSFGIDLVIPQHIKTIVGIDGINRATIRTTLERDKKGFAGHAVISSPMLKGITDNLIVPEISFKHGEDNSLMAKLQFGNNSFTQIFSRHPQDRDCESVYFGANYLDVMNHRIHQTYMKAQNPNHVSTVSPIEPALLYFVLKDGSYKTTTSVREVLWEVVRETTNQHVEKMKHSGLIMKRTITFFHKERKQNIDYFVVSALGSFRIFEGENTNFEKESKTGYVLLTNLPKVTTKLP